MNGSAEGYIEFFVYVIGMGIVIFLLSMLLKEKRIILPLITCLLSFLLILTSFFVTDGWQGLGLLFIGACALLASILNILLMAGTTWYKSKNEKE
ncbi:YesK family protein [Oceanobacillus oncorhynchi]|uniref:YesK-like protein n=1 Tax=Oceanobacillus oncorhynchi TaxID=545501 RepID=A0A0A1MGY3_9BACI|nr:YesK family protein [Oceanobacillus oncorhynchi]MDM8100321.1 YesK family protein [Oceanobacillus oncorhynchi]UUI40865.1 hypothetical protein NP440_04545 [Oceanobacillus oncorhynchi]CEI82303.1 hypothetical protein BN997_02164 [Oceanobacillus oncorhynchi]